MSDDGLDLDAIEAAAQRATFGPWTSERTVPSDPLSQWNVVAKDDDGDVIAQVAYDYDRNYGYGACDQSDAEFIAGAREWIPALVGEVRTLRNQVGEFERHCAGFDTVLATIDKLSAERNAELAALRNRLSKIENLRDELGRAVAEAPEGYTRDATGVIHAELFSILAAPVEQGDPQ